MKEKEFGFEVEFLYFIITENNFVKIGMTNNLPRRLSQLKNKFPSRYKTCKYVKFTTLDDVKGFERLFHEQFKAFRRFGEWFEFPEFMKFCEMKRMKLNMGKEYNYLLFDLPFMDYEIDYPNEDFDG